MFSLEPLPAFTDNYLWLLHDGARAIVVDPGDAAVVQAAVAKRGLELVGALLTHHHADHTGGVMALRTAWPGMRVWGPAFERIAGVDVHVEGGQRIEALGLHFDVIATPGHTAGHIAYFCPQAALADPAPLLFCGDTLFSAGCGRLFEGTPAQMHASLSALAALRADTLVCCAHEYTLANLRFAQAVQPDQADVQAYALACRALRDRAVPTLPSRISTERQVNPFLRCADAGLQQAARQAPGFDQISEQWASFGAQVLTLAALRHWKNVF